MGVGAVAAVLTRLLLLEVLANLRLVVVVWNVKHFVLDFHRQLLSQVHSESKGVRNTFTQAKKAESNSLKLILGFCGFREEISPFYYKTYSVRLNYLNAASL